MIHQEFEGMKHYFSLLQKYLRIIYKYYNLGIIL